MEYGLIGAKLGHSYSKLIHEKLANYTYDLYPLDEEGARAFLQEKAFRAINVTIPYKQLVMPFCDEIDPHASAIGAVNTIVNVDGRLLGHNTDFAGFLALLRAHSITLTDKTVLILGTGGTQRTVLAVAKHEGAREVLCVSRSGGDALTYEQAAARRDVEIIINTTPVGMYPNTGECLVNLEDYPALTAVIDAIYNPFETRLLCLARERGLTYANGLLMLVAQAHYAAEYFLGGKKLDESAIARVTGEIAADRANLVLIGMPGCGKSSLGKACAKILGKQFVDIDAEIELLAGKKISEIFSESGEEVFRALESEVTAKIGKETGLVIASGGGIVKRQENVMALRQNGVFLWVRRDVDALDIGGARPLSCSLEALKAMERERFDLYKGAANASVDNLGSFAQSTEKIVEAFYETAHTQWA